MSSARIEVRKKVTMSLTSGGKTSNPLESLPEAFRPGFQKYMELCTENPCHNLLPEMYRVLMEELRSYDQGTYNKCVMFVRPPKEVDAWDMLRCLEWQIERLPEDKFKDMCRFCVRNPAHWLSRELLPPKHVAMLEKVWQTARAAKALGKPVVAPPLSDLESIGVVRLEAIAYVWSTSSGTLNPGELNTLVRAKMFPGKDLDAIVKGMIKEAKEKHGMFGWGAPGSTGVQHFVRVFVDGRSIAPGRWVPLKVELYVKDAFASEDEYNRALKMWQETILQYVVKDLPKLEMSGKPWVTGVEFAAKVPQMGRVITTPVDHRLPKEWVNDVRPKVYRDDMRAKAMRAVGLPKKAE